MTLAEIETKAGEYLAQRRFGPWSDAAQIELDAWLAQSMHHKVAFWRLEATLTRTERLAALHTHLPGRKAPKREPLTPKLFRMAAMVAIAVVAATLYLQYPSETTYATPVGGHQIVTLADGSTVELNTDTVLRVGREMRTATLERGEAYFRIKHDDTHPFVVTAAGHRVVDLGTEFLVRAEPTGLQVALVEGLARVDAEGNTNRSALLKPGDVVKATKTAMAVEKKTPDMLAKVLGWRHGMLVFDNTTLAEAAAEFNRYNKTKLIIADPKIARLTIGASFPANDVERFARSARILLGVKVQTEENRILLSR